MRSEILSTLRYGRTQLESAFQCMKDEVDNPDDFMHTPRQTLEMRSEVNYIKRLLEEMEPHIKRLEGVSAARTTTTV